jgi:hypothetical protein
VPRFPVRGVLLYQSLKMIKNKDPPRENPSPRRKEVPSNMPRPRRMRGLQLLDRWGSRPGEPFAGLPKCIEGKGQNDCCCLLFVLTPTLLIVCVCVFYYCRTYYKAVRVGGGGEWRTCAMRDNEPRPVWMSLPITH